MFCGFCLSCKITLCQFSRCRQYSTCYIAESSDDILEKYRKQAANSPMRLQESGSGQGAEGSANKVKGKDVTDSEETEGPPAYDPNNLENCKAFKDAKKKLRLVLSTADFQVEYPLFSAVDRFEVLACRCNRKCAPPSSSHLTLPLKTLPCCYSGLTDQLPGNYGCNEG